MKLGKYINSIIPLLLLLTFSNTNNICAESGRSSLLIPERGRFNTYIVIPQRAAELERYAADELAKYIEMITGASITVVKEKDRDLSILGSILPGVFLGCNGIVRRFHMNCMNRTLGVRPGKLHFAKR